jgi:hypothetical protein
MRLGLQVKYAAKQFKKSTIFFWLADREHFCFCNLLSLKRIETIRFHLSLKFFSKSLYFNIRVFVRNLKKKAFFLLPFF